MKNRNINKLQFIFILLFCLIMTACVSKEDTAKNKIKEYDLTLVDKYEFLILEDGQNERETIIVESKDNIEKVNKFLEHLLVTTIQTKQTDEQTACIPKGTVDINFSDNKKLYFEIEQIDNVLYFSNPAEFVSYENKNYADLFKLVLDCK